MNYKVNYKVLIILPVILLTGSLAYLTYGYFQDGEWFLRSTELKGGTVITIKGHSGQGLDLGEFRANVRDIGGFGGQGFIVEIPPEINYQDVLSRLEDSGIPTSQASIRTVGPALGEAFWSQAQIAMVAAFVLMGTVVFFLFRKAIPCIAVIFSAGADIIVTLALMQAFSIELSLAGIAALLMLIGYSVDTDILLTSRVLKGSGEMDKRYKDAFVTGITMTSTAVGTMAVLVIANISLVITQIASVLLIGLLVDIVNTWMTNAGLLKWYMEGR